VNLPPFQQLLDAHGADVHRFCVAQAGPPPGSDCFPDAVFAALRAYPDPRDDRNLRGGLYTIAPRMVLDHHRAAARRPVPVPELPERGSPATPVDADVWEAVGRLPEKQRGAIALRYLGDLPYAEIGVVLGCSEAAARQNVRAGLAALRLEVTP
jgi:RNA polymerase sigma factor (sigma-70 family)